MNKEKYLFILGAMKAGTTTLFHYLSQHPEVCRAKKKETDYFVNSELNQDISEYNKLFDFNPRVHQYMIDASTSFTKFPAYKNIPLKIYQSGIKPKMIYIVRNPIDRINSEINFWRNHPHWSHPKHKKNLNDMVARSSYNLQLSQYMDFFSKQDILILDFELLKTDPQKLFDRICDFCDLEPLTLDRTDIVANKTQIKSDFELKLSLKNKIIVDLIPQKIKTHIKNILRVLSKTSKWELSNIEKSLIIRQLENDMYDFHENFEFDVSKWGFKP